MVHTNNEKIFINIFSSNLRFYREIFRYREIQQSSSNLKLLKFKLKIVNLEVTNGFGTYTGRPKVDLREYWKKEEIPKSIVGRLVGYNRRLKKKC